MQCMRTVNTISQVNSQYRRYTFFLSPVHPSYQYPHGLIPILLIARAINMVTAFRSIHVTTLLITIQYGRKLVTMLHQLQFKLKQSSTMKVSGAVMSHPVELDQSDTKLLMKT